jgi:hypothetical protein
MNSQFKSFKLFKPFKPPPSSSPAVAGEEQRWGLELSVAVEQSEAIEQIERFLPSYSILSAHHGRVMPAAGR